MSQDSTLLSRKHKITKTRWNSIEDEMLLNYVKIAKLNEIEDIWSYISYQFQKDKSEYINLKTSKQCRERYIYHLSGDIKENKTIKLADKIKILEMNLTYGNQWKTIGKMLGYSSDYNIRNCYYNELRKLIRFIRRQLKKIIFINFTEINKLLISTPFFCINEDLIREKLQLGNIEIDLKLDEYFYDEYYSKVESNINKQNQYKVSWNQQVYSVYPNVKDDLISNLIESKYEISNTICFEKKSFSIEAAYFVESNQ